MNRHDERWPTDVQLAGGLWFPVEGHIAKLPRQLCERH